jgi:hypothetical protein
LGDNPAIDGVTVPGTSAGVLQHLLLHLRGGPGLESRGPVGARGLRQDLPAVAIVLVQHADRLAGAVEGQVVREVQVQVAVADKTKQRELRIGVGPVAHDVADHVGPAGHRRAALPEPIIQVIVNGGDDRVVDQVVDDRRPRAALDLRITLHVAGEEISQQQHLRAVVHDQAALRVSHLAVRRAVESLRDDIVAERHLAGGVLPPFVGVAPSKGLLEVLRFSSIPHENEQWSTMT